MTGDDLGRWMTTPELQHSMLRAKQRWDAGITTTLECAIEQMDAWFAVNPGGCRELKLLMRAMKDFNDGDETALEALLGKPPNAKLRALRRRRAR